MGVIHEPCRQIFAHFDPLPLCGHFFLNGTYVAVWTFGKPPTPCHVVHMVNERPLSKTGWTGQFLVLEFIIRVYLTIQSKKFTFSSYLRPKMFVYFLHPSVTLACGVKCKQTFLASNMKKRWIFCSVWWGSFKKLSLVH